MFSQAMMAGLLLVRVFLLYSVAYLESFSRKAIPSEAGGAICSLSKKLKNVAPWTREKMATLMKSRDEHESKYFDWKLHFHASPECQMNESVLDEIRTMLENVNTEFRTLHSKAVRARALAARSAGRLDEFITVFANAKGNGTTFKESTNYCLGSGGAPAKRRDLLDCFPKGEEFEMSETNMAKIPETTSYGGELDLSAAIENINYNTAAAYVKKGGAIDVSANCNLIKGSGDGILGSTSLEKPLWWGGGILTIGKDFDGDFMTDGSKFIAGEIESSSTDSSKAFWTESPHTIPHLKNTLAAFQSFKSSAERISRKLTEIAEIEKQIETCLSHGKVEDVHAQTCFKNIMKLNAELHDTNTLLERYRKEKGALPSGSTFIMRQETIGIWLLSLLILL
ncbi:Transferrin receptor-like, ESAG6-like [Trypanosoma congolense IL3000]|uniref:Transferrin receptor-like, ESAG6-like n=1 Tax=Trypanosoma congolense (strain IL3000) TaxID=1068625 RepID=F9WCZ6_TRYCI|nr:Transferrin receptor-like, ESAG6-like [Trypanosoma congolense IL3000]